MASVVILGRRASRWVVVTAVVVLGSAGLGGCVSGTATAGPTPGVVDDAYALKVVSDEVSALGIDVSLTDDDVASVAADAKRIIAAHAARGSAAVCAEVSDLSVDVIAVYGDAQGFAGDLDAFRDDVGLIRGDHAQEAATAIQTVDAHIDAMNKDMATAYADASQAAQKAGCPGPNPTPAPLPHVDA